MAFFVVGIHCANGFGFSADHQPISALNASIFRIAVPFFLFASAFFTAKKGLVSAFFKTALRYAILYAVWTIIYTPIIIYQQFLPFAPAYHEGILPFVHRTFCSGSVTLLWYLLGGAIGFILAALSRLLRMPMIVRLGFSFALFFVGAFGDSYFGFLPLPTQNIYQGYFSWGITTLNGFFYCWFFIELACFFAERRHFGYGQPPRVTVCLTLLVVSILLLLLESVLICRFSKPRDMNFLFATVFVTPSLFGLCFSLPPIKHIKGLPLAPISSFIYFPQLYALALYKVLFSNYPPMQNENLKWLVIVAFLTAASILITWLVVKIKKPWVKFLY